MSHLVLLSPLLSLAGCPAVNEEVGPPHILLVSLDTMRADRLGAYGHEGGLTPNLDRFATESVLFESAWAQATETLFSHASLFTSRYPTELGPMDYDFTLPETALTLAGVLGTYGYETAAFTGGGHLHRDFGFKNGFQTYRDELPWGVLFHAVRGMGAYLDAATSEGPRFLFVHGYDAHPRYLKPAPFGFLHVDENVGEVTRELLVAPLGTTRLVDGIYFPGAEPSLLVDQGVFRRKRQKNPGGMHRPGPPLRFDHVRLGQEDLAQVEGAYNGAVAYADAWFGLMMADLQERGLLDNSVVVVFSDHGEELGESGVYNHRYSLSDPVLHVPLMIRMPGGKGGGRRVKETVELVDLMPTLLKLAGAVVPANARGTDLLGPRRESPAFSEGPLREISARGAGGRLTFSGVGADSPFLSDLLKVADLDGPAFWWSDSLAREEVPEMRDQLLAWRAGISPPRAPTSTLSEEQRQRLQEKGYWDPR